MQAQLLPLNHQGQVLGSETSPALLMSNALILRHSSSSLEEQLSGEGK
jgi:hypothetical protein